MSPRKLWFSRYSLFACSLLLFLHFGCREEGSQSIRKEPISFKKEGELSIRRADIDSTLIRLDIEIADTDYEIQTGMMYREAMGDLQGMLFIFEDIGPRSFYMKNTLIPLDIIFIDENTRIISIHRNAEPLNENGIPSGGDVKYVLEVKGGMSDRWALQQGDLIRYEKTP